MKAKPKRKPAKVTTWRGWGILDDAGKFEHAEENRQDAIAYMRFYGGHLVRVVAKMTEVKS